MDWNMAAEGRSAPDACHASAHEYGKQKSIFAATDGKLHRGGDRAFSALSLSFGKKPGERKNGIGNRQSPF